MLTQVQSPSVQRTVLYQNEAFEIVSILWFKGTTSPFHNHGWSQCHVFIEEGMFENKVQLGAKNESQILQAKEILTTPVGSSHEVRCLSDYGKTIHVYVPKIEVFQEATQKFSASLPSDLMSSIGLGEPVDIDTLIQLHKLIVKNSISTNSKFFMNQLFAGIHPQSILADQTLAQTKTTMATFEASPVFTKVEQEVANQLCQLVGWFSDESEGITVPGGSAANFMALQLAKQKKFPQAKVKGLQGMSCKIFVSQDAHYSFEKAAIAMGFGSESLVKIKVDPLGKMIPDLLQAAMDDAVSKRQIPLMVCATSGTTVYGAFDPIEEVAEICRKYSVWLHVDGAWGGPALFSKRARYLMAGIHLADSVTFDAHKFFGASLTCSFLLNRHKGLLLEANDVSGADYLFHENDNVDLGKRSWQCGRKAEAFSFWSLWKSLGTQGLGDFLDRLLVEKEKAVEWIKTQPRLQLISEPEFLNICVRVLDQNLQLDRNLSQKIREELKLKNIAMINYSSDTNGSFLRLILAHPQLDAQLLIQILKMALDIKC